MENNRIFYGWINVVACIAVMFGLYGIGNATISLYLKPISDDLAISRTSISSIVSIISLTGAVFSFLYGKIVKRIGIKPLLIIGAIAACVGFAAFSILNNVIVFYIFSAIIGFGFIVGTTIPLSAIIQNWFVEKRGLVLGIVFSASGIGGMIFNPLISKLIIDNGWRTAFRIEALIMLIVVLPAALLISIHPREKGTVALGEEATKKTDEKVAVKGLTLSEARKTTSFKLVVISILCSAMGIVPLHITSPAYLSDIGFDPSFPAKVLSVLFIVNTIFKILLGIVNDKFGLKTVLIVGYSSFFIADIFLILTKTELFAYAFGVFFGIALCMFTVPLPLVITTLYGQKDYSSIMGICMCTLTIGASIGIPLCSASYDFLGNYTPAYIINGVLVAIALVTVLVAIRLKPSVAALDSISQTSEKSSPTG